MGFRSRIGKRGLWYTTIVVLLVAGVTACNDPFDITAVVTNEVLAANNLFLEITNMSPADGADDVNPGRELLVAFDRELDVSTISQTSIRLERYDSDIDDWVDQPWTSFRYDADTDTLYVAGVDGSPILDNDTQYKITIVGLRDPAGYGLPETIERTFTTGTYPAGYITSITSGGSLGDNGASQEGYTDVLNVDVNMQINYRVTHYVLTDDYSKVSESSYYANPANESDWIAVDPLVSTQPTANFSSFSDSANGEKTVYVLFRDTSDLGDIRYGAPMPGQVIYDTVAPSAPSVTGDTVTVDITPSFPITGGNGVGLFRGRIGSGSWNSTDGTSSLTYTAASSAITDNADNTANVQERDAAGNWSSSGSHTTEVVSVLPRDGGNLNPFFTTATLQWRRPLTVDRFDQAMYYVQVSSSASFSTPPSTPPHGSISETSTPIAVSDGNEYFWRVVVYTRSLFVGGVWGFHAYYPSASGADFEVGWEFLP